MHRAALLALGADLALAIPSALYGRGSSVATIQNHCPYPVYLWSTPGGSQLSSKVPMVTLDAYDRKAGASNVYSENLHQSADGSGVSIKIALITDVWKASSENAIEQLEYAVNPTMNQIFYDLSEINGAPFTAKGNPLKLASAPGCPVITSANAYKRPDDTATHACSMPNDLVLTLCSP
jgi:Blastomyces yeast-phase-specific protein